MAVDICLSGRAGAFLGWHAASGRLSCHNTTHPRVCRIHQVGCLFRTSTVTARTAVALPATPPTSPIVQPHSTARGGAGPTSGLKEQALRMLISQAEAAITALLAQKEVLAGDPAQVALVNDAIVRAQQRVAAAKAQLQQVQPTEPANIRTGRIAGARQQIGARRDMSQSDHPTAGCQSRSSSGLVSASELLRTGKQPGAGFSQKPAASNLSGSGKAVGKHRPGAPNDDIVVTVTHKVCALCGEDKPADMFPKRARASTGLAARCRACKSLEDSKRRQERTLAVVPAAKVCTRCGVEKEPAAFPRTNGSATGLRPRCKECVVIDRARHRAAKPVKLQLVPKVEEKRCSVCKALKTAGDFNRDVHNPSGLASQCRPCQRSSSSARRSRLGFSTPVDQKVCSRCKVEQLAINFNRERAKPSGLSAWCKGCKRSSDILRRLRKAYLPLLISHKLCTRCGEDKSVDAYTRNSSNPTGLNSWCRTCKRDAERSRPHVRRRPVATLAEADADAAVDGVAGVTGSVVEFCGAESVADIVVAVSGAEMATDGGVLEVHGDSAESDFVSDASSSSVSTQTDFAFGMNVEQDTLLVSDGSDVSKGVSSLHSGLPSESVVDVNGNLLVFKPYQQWRQDALLVGASHW